MRSTGAIALTFIVLFALLLLLPFACGGYGLVWERTFAPAREETRRQTYQESNAHVQGTIDDLYLFRQQYESAPPEQKAAIADLARNTAHRIRSEQIPSDLKPFMDKLGS